MRNNIKLDVREASFNLHSHCRTNHLHMNFLIGRVLFRYGLKFALHKSERCLHVTVGPVVVVKSSTYANSLNILLEEILLIEENKYGYFRKELVASNFIEKFQCFMRAESRDILKEKLDLEEELDEISVVWLRLVA